jgi:hypothetical protein
MTAPSPCPVCGSTDLIAVPRTNPPVGKAEPSPETTYLCDLGHMFGLPELNQAERATALIETDVIPTGATRPGTT